MCFTLHSRCESEELKPEPAALGGEWGAGQVSQALSGIWKTIGFGSVFVDVNVNVNVFR